MWANGISFIMVGMDNLGRRVCWHSILVSFTLGLRTHLTVSLEQVTIGGSHHSMDEGRGSTDVELWSEDEIRLWRKVFFMWRVIMNWNALSADVVGTASNARELMTTWGLWGGGGARPNGIGLPIAERLRGSNNLLLCQNSSMILWSKLSVMCPRRYWIQVFLSGWCKKKWTWIEFWFLFE